MTMIRILCARDHVTTNTLWAIQCPSHLEAVSKDPGVAGSHVRMKNGPGCPSWPVGAGPF